MTLAELRAKARKYTRTNATNYPNADLDDDINQAYAEIWLMILEAEGYKNTGGDFKVLDLEDSSSLSPQDLGYNGEYPFPSIAMNLEEAFIDYGDGAVKAEIINKSEMNSSMFEDEDDPEFSEDYPKIFVFRDSILIRPIHFDTTVTDGIKLLIRRRQRTLVAALSGDEAVAANQTLTPEFESNLHQLIPIKVAQDYYLIYPDKYNPRIDKKASELESQLISFYESRTPIEKRLQIPNTDRGLKGW